MAKNGHTFSSHPFTMWDLQVKFHQDSMDSMEFWIWLGRWDLGKHMANRDLKKGCPSLSAAMNPSSVTTMWISPANLQENESLIKEGPNHSGHPSWRPRYGNEATLEHPAPGKPFPPRITTQPTHKIMRSNQCCFKPLEFEDGLLHSKS